MLDLALAAVCAGLIARLAKKKGYSPPLFGLITVGIWFGLAWGITLAAVLLLPESARAAALCLPYAGALLGVGILEEVLRKLPTNIPLEYIYCSQCGARQEWKENALCTQCGEPMHK